MKFDIAKLMLGAILIAFAVAVIYIILHVVDTQNDINRDTNRIDSVQNKKIKQNSHDIDRLFEMHKK